MRFYFSYAKQSIENTVHSLVELTNKQPVVTQKIEDTSNGGGDKKEPKMSVYIYNQETTLYQETLDITNFFDFIKEVEKKTNPTYFFITAEKKMRELSQFSIIFGLKMTEKDKLKFVIEEIIEMIEQRKKLEKNIKLSCTFYYANHINNYVVGEPTEFEKKEIDKRKDIFTANSNNLKFLARVVNLKNVPHSEEKVTTEAERELDDQIRLHIITQKRKETNK